jgi:hypothetical protein
VVVPRHVEAAQPRPADQLPSHQPEDIGIPATSYLDVQRAADPVEDVVPEVPTSTGTGITSTAGPPASGQPSLPTDLDELARRLYEPLSARIRAELWLDRERAGLLTEPGR